jgi:hypothetical protein
VTILKENKNRSGVYRLINNVNGKSYVGSSTNLTHRFYWYFNTKNLVSRNTFTICKALLKYGYSNFTLEILEYCDPDSLISREQYYLDLLNPEYNILPAAGSTRGRFLSQQHKAKISATKLGVKPSKETLEKLRKHLAVFNMSKGFKVEVTDLETGVTSVYASLAKAGEAVNSSSGALSAYCKKQALGYDKPWKKDTLLKY